MSTYLRLTPALRDVLTCLLAANDEVWGFNLATLSGRPRGTVYPTLERLERSGFVSSRWEEGEGRGPRRRFYQLTAEGRQWAGAKLHRAPGIASGRMETVGKGVDDGTR